MSDVISAERSAGELENHGTTFPAKPVNPPVQAKKPPVSSEPIPEKPAEMPAPVEEAPETPEGASDESEQAEGDTTANTSTVPAKKESARFLAMEPWLQAGRPRKKWSLRRFAWWLYTFVYKYRWFRWIPQPRAFGTYRSEVSWLATRIKSRRAKSGGIISVITASGGATKSTITTWLAVVLAFVQRFSVGVFDTDTGVGQVHLRYGLDADRSVPVDDLVELVCEHGYEPDYNELAMNTVADDATGVLVYHCKPGTKLAKDDVRKTVKVLQKKHQYIIGDTAPGLGRTETDGLVAASGVTIVVGRAEALDNRNGIREALKHDEYNFGKKERVVIVLSGVKWSKFNTRNQYRQAHNFGVNPEQIVLVPKDNYVIRNAKLGDADETNPQVLLDMMAGKNVNLDRIRPKTKYAFFRVADVVTELMVRYNEDHPQPTLQKILSDKRAAKKAPEPTNPTQLDSSETSVTAQ